MIKILIVGSISSLIYNRRARSTPITPSCPRTAQPPVGAALCRRFPRRRESAPGRYGAPPDVVLTWPRRNRTSQIDPAFAALKAQYSDVLGRSSPNVLQDCCTELETCDTPMLRSRLMRRLSDGELA